MSFGKKYADVANVANAVQQALTGKEKKEKKEKKSKTNDTTMYPSNANMNPQGGYQHPHQGAYSMPQPGLNPHMQGGYQNPQPGAYAMPQGPNPHMAQPGGYLPPQHQAPGMGMPPQPMAFPNHPQGVGAPGGYPGMGTQPQPYGHPSAQMPYAATGHPYSSGHQMSFSGQKVEITVSATNLKNKDFLGKSDPVCILLEKKNGKFEELDRTEMIHNDLNPQWTKKFLIDYHSNLPQELRFEIYDWDSKADLKRKQDHLGYAQTTLSKILTTGQGQKQLVLTDGGHGRINIYAEQVGMNTMGKVKIQFKGIKLDNKDFLGKSDPYYILKKKMPNGDWSLVYKSEYIENDLNPTWKAMEKPMSEICNGDFQRHLKIEVYDYDSNGSDDLIGEVVTTLGQLQHSCQMNEKGFPLINSERKKRKKNYINSGTLSISQFQYR